MSMDEEFDWSASKSSVSALHEYSAKTKCDPPKYEFIGGDVGSFICRVTLGDKTADGCGRSKRDAKHRCSAIMIHMIRFPHAHDAEQKEDDFMSEAATTDMIVTLRDYCVLKNHPLPTIEIIQQAGTPDAPEFTALCKLASLQRFGVSEKKKEAKQIAATEMFRLITRVCDNGNDDGILECLNNVQSAEDIEAERYIKFKTYRELTESKSCEMPGTLLCDRHMYFTKFFDDLKREAIQILQTEYISIEKQVEDLFRVLKITPKVTELNFPNLTEPMLLIELNCVYDVVFSGLKPSIYNDIIDYFKDMLD